MTIDPRDRYVVLDGAGHATVVPGGEAFWSQSEEELERFGKGWLISEFRFAADWPQWELHPEADEFVYLLDGHARLLLDGPAGVAEVALAAPAAAVVPRGIWHTVRTAVPCRMLHVTRGGGTLHRPAAG